MSNLARERVATLQRGIERGRNLLDQLLTLAKVQATPDIPKSPVPERGDRYPVLKPVTWVNEQLRKTQDGPNQISGALAANAITSSELPELDLNFVSLDVPPAPLNPHFPDVWERIRAGFAMPDLNIKETSDSLAFYGARPQCVASVLTRSRPYLFHIVEEIEKRKMPMELALLPFIESGFDPMANSPAQASGLWQFIPETGLRFNLPQNAAYDARRDVMASTRAALDYLQFLHGMFNDWHLALASYNWGENAVARAVATNRARGLPTQFANLNMPDETRYYVPRLLAVKQLISNPQRHGLVLPSIPNGPYFTSVARIGTGTPRRDVMLDIRDVARFAEVDVGEFRALNAAHSEGVINLATVPVLVPLDKAQSFAERLEAYIEREGSRRRVDANRAPNRLNIR